jgi:formylglycine-generating enzyme required for sulfatase activity
VSIKLAKKRVSDFQLKYGDRALELAYHAALPVAFNAELLHLLRINFFVDTAVDLPYDTEFQLLLSPLCREIDEDLYEIEPEIRDILLGRLQPIDNGARVRDVASLLKQYIDRYTPWHDRKELQRAQQLTAFNILDRAKCREWLGKNKLQLEIAGERDWYIAMNQDIDRQNKITDGEIIKSYPLSTFSFETAQVKLVGRKIEITKIPGSAQYFVENLGYGVTLDMVYVPAGQFHMGSLSFSNERPQHTVEVPAFYMSKYPITQAQYLEFIGINYSHFSGSLQLPIESVSWKEAQAFCDKLVKCTNKPYSLPSEAQWEYACRANTKTPFYFGEKISSDLANYDASSRSSNAPYGTYGEGRKTTTDVGSFPPNSFGLCDLYGNVWEWCIDTWHENYNGAPKDGSAWVDKSSTNYRVLRGGSWSNYPASCRSAHRHKYAPNSKANNIGFRIVLPIPKVP